MRFIWQQNTYEICALPNGLAIGPRVFSKLLKCVFAELRKRGFVNTGYIDDSVLQGDTYSECEENILQTTQLFDQLGFTVHPEKSVFVPTQNLNFLDLF